MKKKDLLYLILAVGILLVAGYVVVTQLMPKDTTKQEGVTVEVVGAIEPDYDSVSLSELGNAEKVQDFSVPFDLTTGLGNPAIFGN